MNGEDSDTHQRKLPKTRYYRDMPGITKLNKTKILVVLGNGSNGAAKCKAVKSENLQTISASPPVPKFWYNIQHG